MDNRETRWWSGGKLKRWGKVRSDGIGEGVDCHDISALHVSNSFSANVIFGGNRPFGEEDGDVVVEVTSLEASDGSVDILGLFCLEDGDIELFRLLNICLAFAVFTFDELLSISNEQNFIIACCDSVDSTTASTWHFSTSKYLPSS